jgi:tetratricopeptide (TPR) repeat protein
MSDADRENSKIFKDILFGLLFFLFTVSLILFIPVGQAIVAERYTYISYIGIFIILGRLYLFFYQAGSARRRYGLTAAVASAAILFSCMTYTRNQVWKDSMTLFSDMIEKNPDAGLAYNNRGNLRMEQEDFEGAIEDFNKAIELKDTNAHYNRGILRLRLGDYQNALDDFNLAEQNLRVDKAKVLYNLGITKLNLGDFRGAEEDFSGVIRINPRHAGAWSNRGLIRYDKLSDIMGAITDLDEAVSLDPDDPYIRYNRGNARMLAGKTTESLADYDRTLELMPLFAAVHLNKGAALLQSGRIDEACRSWEKAAELGEKAAGGLTAKYCKGNR